jgi:hypothetical protein
LSNTLLDLEKAIRSQGFTPVEENGDLFILQKEKQIITTLRIEEDKKRILIRSHIQNLRLDESRRSGVVELRSSNAFEEAHLAPALLSCVRGAERLREVFDQFPDQSFDVIAAAEFFFSGGQVLPADL